MTPRGPDFRAGRPDLRPLALASGVVFLDAATKILAGALASRGFARAIVAPTQNADFWLGVVSAHRPIMLVLAGLVILLFAGYTALQVKRSKVPGWVPGLMIGGAVANLLDRLLFGAVHDWLYLPKVVINLADVAVVVGVIGYLVVGPLRSRARN